MSWIHFVIMISLISSEMIEAVISLVDDGKKKKILVEIH